MKAKKELDDQIKTFQQSYGYLDVMLLDREGRSYTPAMTSTPPLNWANLCKTGSSLRKAKKESNLPMSFSALEEDRRVEMIGIAPIRDLQGAFVGAVALEIDMVPIFKFIQDTTGLGKPVKR